MAQLTVQKNMGTADRVIRGTLGAALLFGGLMNMGRSSLRIIPTAIGGAFFAYGLSGFDPLLAAMDSTTIPGTETNILNRFRHAMPGQGVKPSLTQNVVPQKPLKPFHENITVSEALMVGV